MENRIELWVSPTGNVAIYRGSAFISTEQLTEEERLFVLDRVCNELKGKDLDAEIKKYTESLYNETFGNGQGTLDEFDWEDISTVIEDTARYFYSFRPQPHWRPSECQMDSLREIADFLPEGPNLEYLEEVIYALDQQKDDCFSWKPSEELLDALHTAAYLREMDFYGGLKDKLRELDTQLRELM